MDRIDGITAYFELAAQRPDLFVQSETVPLVLDEGRMRAFSEKSGKSMGLVYDNRPYYMVLADLCLDGEREFSYARVVYPQPGTNGSVAIPRKDGKFGLLRQYRHPPRAESLEFPRGFGERGLTPEENVRKELREEMGAVASGVTCLGSIRADTGLSAGCIQIFLAEISSYDVQVGHEGIRELVWLTEEAFREAVAAGDISDGITLSAYALLRCQSE